jgi:hypothetical protein
MTWVILTTYLFTYPPTCTYRQPYSRYFAFLELDALHFTGVAMLVIKASNRANLASMMLDWHLTFVIGHISAMDVM